jgi:hypothetical protein
MYQNIYLAGCVWSLSVHNKIDVMLSVCAAAAAFSHFCNSGATIGPLALHTTLTWYMEENNVSGARRFESLKSDPHIVIRLGLLPASVCELKSCPCDFISLRVNARICSRILTSDPHTQCSLDLFIVWRPQKS